MADTKHQDEEEFGFAIIHYGEIGIKGKNRSYFEEKLMDNIKAKLGDMVEFCKRESGHLTLGIKNQEDIDKIKDALLRIPGVAYFSFAKKVPLDIESIKENAVSLLKNKDFETFKVDTRRHNKNNEFKSMEVNAVVGEAVINALKKKVIMKNPDIMVKVEISHKCAYISLGEIQGVGGLPTNRRQRVVCLLSGGFDSPVAAYFMMRRGCEVILVHFQNQSQIKCSVQNKVVELAKQLSKYQVYTKLYIVPFETLQKEIIKNVEASMRMLVYRRFMIRIASGIASLEKASFLVVGDSLSQVASQTFDNLKATYADSEKHILSPLIGIDKNEIIDIARRIGTYDISSLPYGDCCTYFLPKSPELKAHVKVLRAIEQGFDAEPLIDEAIKSSSVMEL